MKKGEEEKGLIDIKERKEDEGGNRERKKNKKSRRGREKGIKGGKEE